jgi:putative aldouronate transport system substrate-binding protein
VLPWGESATYLKNGADYEKIMMEGFTKIIIGEQPISYVDTIIKDVRALDVQTACAEITALMN